MGILTKLGWRSLRTTRGRTLMTIGAMALAATLAVASLVGLRSVQMSFYRYALQNTGGMLAALPATTPAKAAKLRADPAFRKTVSYVEEGRATLGQTRTNHIQEPFHLAALASADKAMLKPLLVSGRVPARADEVLMSDLLVTDHRNVGSTIKVTVAKRTKTYRVVGTMNGYNPSFLPTDGLIRVAAKRPAGRTVVMVDLKSLSDARAQLKAITKRAGLKQDQLQVNDEALSTMWGSADARKRSTLVTVVAVIMAIVGAVALIMIYTSINLSVRAHRQRYGLLRSIGTTPHQLRHLVYGEALMLAAPALVLGGVVGIGGLAVAFHLMNGVLAGNLLPITLILTVDWLPLVGAAVFMALITLLAAARPAWRASRVTPIAAIRALDPSPRLTQRRLRTPWWMQYLHQPLLRLAAKFDRREGRRGTMLATLVVTVALFVGLTGFVGNIWRIWDSPTSADITAVVSGRGDQTGAMRQLIRRLDGIQRSLVTRQANLVIRRDAAAPTDDALTGMGVTLYVVTDARAQRDFAGQPTLLNTKLQYVDAKGHATIDWAVDPKVTKLKLTASDGEADTKAGRVVSFKVMPLAKAPGFGGMLYPDGQIGLVVGTSQYRAWAKGLNLPARDLQTAVALKLTRPAATHTTVVKALKGRFGQLPVTDTVADNQQALALTTVIRTACYGFITLIALVCLATVVNHTFASLMTARRGLAMLQSIGTTPRQVVAMQGWQYAMLLVRGWLIGSVLGVGLSVSLFKMMIGGYQQVHIIWPWAQVLIAGAGLLVVGLVFVLVTWRMLNRQDIDQLLRTA
ncbi:ABC transporter permease [Lacticaseibacillus absianus]|uniref:ABC transporter permease n=1 Tax=Lacticaseibacillus absianus TaxID=2729623 RepID=UPI0015CAEE8E|nr:FtsX-like permease family protein [Lacticaseibacillus absianus]